MRSKMRTMASGAAVAAALAAAPPGAAQSSVVHTESTSGGVRTTVDARGDLRLSADGVRAIAPGGMLTVEEARPGAVRRVEYRPGEGGVSAAFYRDGRAVRPGAAEQAWMRAAVIFAARQGVGDPAERVAAIRARGGVSAVLAEIEQVRGESARAGYYVALLRGPLAAGQGVQVLADARRQVRGEGERAALLRAVAESPDTPAEGLAAALSGASTLRSGGDRAEILRAVARRGALGNAGVRDAFFSALRGVDSDGDRMGVLMEIPPAALRDARVREAALAAANLIAGERDRARVLGWIARADGRGQ